MNFNATPERDHLHTFFFLTDILQLSRVLWKHCFYFRGGDVVPTVISVHCNNGASFSELLFALLSFCAAHSAPSFLPSFSPFTNDFPAGTIPDWTTTDQGQERNDCAAVKNMRAKQKGVKRSLKVRQRNTRKNSLVLRSTIP